MKKVLNILFFGITLGLISCSELPEYELPYELAPTAAVNLNVVVTASNAKCPGPVATFSVDSESQLFYVVQLSSNEALTSDEVFDNGEVISFDGENSQDIQLEGLDFEENYTLYAITVNKNGVRSEEVTSTSLSMPTFNEVVDLVLATNYSGASYYSGTLVSEFDVTLTAEGGYVFTSNALWGDFVAWAYGNPAYSGYYQYPGTLTLNEDLGVDVASEEFYAEGGEGSFDPCTGTFNFTVLTNLFDDPDTAELETEAVDVVLTPVE